MAMDIVGVSRNIRRIMRTRPLSRRCAKVGKNLILYEGIKIHSAAGLTVGNNVSMNDEVWINASGGVEIGNNVLIGPKTVIHSANHRYEDPHVPIRFQGISIGRLLSKMMYGSAAASSFYRESELEEDRLSAREV